MKQRLVQLFAVLLTLTGAASTASADDGSYVVTITNLTRGSVFTPALVVTHKKGLSVFTEGAAASDELAQLAEGGATQPLLDALTATGKVEDSGTSGLIFPGTSVSVTVKMDDDAKRISFASMILPTNDGFIGANGIKGPGKGKTRVMYIKAMDAGSEMNDEFCLSIPGPHCGGGEGYNAAGGEGYVHVHAGIHGEADLKASDYDWRNPVAKVSITRIK